MRVPPVVRLATTTLVIAVGACARDVVTPRAVELTPLRVDDPTSMVGSALGGGSFLRAQADSQTPMVLEVRPPAASIMTSPVTYTARATFESQGTIAFNYGYEDFGSSFSFPGDPWTSNGVTYTTGSNLIVGTGTGYFPPSNVFCYNGWTPSKGNIASGYDMFGLNIGMLGSTTSVTATITTNLATYVFSGLAIPHWTAGGAFLGFVAQNAGEFFTSFSFSSAGGSGSAPCLDNVTLGTSVPQDATPPVITPTITGTLGNDGWYTSNVDISWTVTDPESAVSSTSGCGLSTVATDGSSFSFTCSATSTGGTSSATATVKRDATDPSIAFTGNAGTYTVDETVNITCNASDATSGLAVSTCPGASGDAYTFGLGVTTLSASATDNAGNDASASASFTVTVTTASLCALVERFVSKPGVANSLCQKLDAAAAADNEKTKGNILRAFGNELNAQAGKSVSAANASLLASLANAL